LYSDEVTFKNRIDKILTSHFKPDFAIDNLRANNYICHFSVFKRELINKVGKFRPKFDGSQDHDMVLRLTASAKIIFHIPKVLYFWRSYPNSTSLDIASKKYAIEAGKNAVKEHLSLLGMTARIESSRAFPTIYRIIYEITEKPLVSIIIPNKDNIEYLKKCIRSIISNSTYTSYEIIVVENNSKNNETFDYYEEIKKPNNIKIIYWENEFNFSEINNYAVKFSQGRHLIFLSNDIEIIAGNWIEEMLMYSQRRDVGAVGAKLYYQDNTIQHAGIVIGLGEDRIAGHIFYKVDRGSVGYMGKLEYAQNMSAVTAACMMVRRSVFDEVGGFDPQFKISYNDIDLCMRIRKAGYLIVWTPYAELYHHESKSRGLDSNKKNRIRFMKEINLFKERWSKELALGDPYYNINLTLNRSDYSIKLINKEA
jgi:GT2 family glycosyltransferase